MWNFELFPLKKIAGLPATEGFIIVIALSRQPAESTAYSESVYSLTTII